ncbi:hypothetical protein [Aquipuribacter nitratireducens]|uniref:DUF1524 domain-containing protein n=1 Tax=Aquipuribacter nitratireducens TaxID=650104 RepID=A0ABW0GLH2_9MICO
MRRRHHVTVTVAVALLTASALAGPAAATADPSVYAHPRELLRALPVAAEGGAGFSPAEFEHWVDADGDDCDTREEVLISEARVRATVGAGCEILDGQWRSWYDATTVTSPGGVVVDHLVGLAEAWDSGASRWSAETRRAYANDTDFRPTLSAVGRAVESAKGDQDPAEWTPSLFSLGCRYATEWIMVKYRWGLAVDTAEKAALSEQISGGCALQNLRRPERATIVLDTPAPQMGSELLVYDADRGRRVLVDLRADGSTGTFSDTTWSAGWDAVTAVEVDGTPGSELVVYDADRGRRVLVDLRADGSTGTFSDTTWSAGWDAVTAVEVDGTPGSELVVYDADRGRRVLVDLFDDGSTGTISDTVWSVGWETVASVEVDGTPGSELLVYDADRGRRVLVDLFDDGSTGTFTDTTWSAGWDVVTAVEADGT